MTARVIYQSVCDRCGTQTTAEPEIRRGRPKPVSAAAAPLPSGWERIWVPALRGLRSAEQMPEFFDGHELCRGCWISLLDWWREGGGAVVMPPAAEPAPAAMQEAARGLVRGAVRLAVLDGEDPSSDPGEE